jgi:hypothetical protein
LSGAAQPRDAGGLPRGPNVSRDRIVRAVIKRDQDQRPSEKKRGRKWARQPQSVCRGGLNKERTFVIKSRASAETFDGIRRSTFAIRLYVAGTRHQRTPVSTRAPRQNRETRQKRHTVVSGHLLEWRRTNNKLVRKHAECPIIDFLVVLAALDHLGW